MCSSFFCCILLGTFYKDFKDLLMFVKELIFHRKNLYCKTSNCLNHIKFSQLHIKVFAGPLLDANV